jgi:hypothetical protein
MMLFSTKALPDGYIQTHEIDLAKNKGLAILLNILGFIIFVLTFIILVLFTRWVRPGQLTGPFAISGGLTTVGQLLGLIVLVALNLALHELIHGFFFWVFTRSKPVYALHLAYAYAAAPDWFIPVRQYWIIGLAPLVIIDSASLLLILVVPASWLLTIVFLVTLNTGGAVGDLLITSYLLRSSPACLVKDQGDGVRFFEPRLPPSNLP